MSTATGSFVLEPNAELLPGYCLASRLGSGGYGEVWKATAPGGLSKAIKIIHGDIGGNQAVRELRSLERAKTLNHPFLLSLERIEIVDGHLLIVMELADATLRDRFNECRNQGFPGIPRDELLNYMREAADALDYLFESHGLQHLDVKPENILLRGKHVKVADFGLLKDLQESCASFVNGMTPKYSAPEVFGGKPGHHSDQYSLAVVYQEMLTGRLPFAGSNIATLASQHVNATPDLTPLTPLERFAVGKALSKNPDHRFPNCQAFVERLMYRSSTVLSPPTAKAGGDQGGGSTAAHMGPARAAAANQIHDGHTIEIAAPEIHSLPRLSPPEGALTYRPTVFIGIGSTGGRVLSKLRQVIADRVGDPKSLPAVQFLYVDTDTDSLASITRGHCTEGLEQDEILITPLAQTSDYRSSAVSNVESLSRRWIYNVPKSLRTQGLRALGRIALLDHADRLLDRMRRAITKCTHSESVATSSEKSGLKFGESDPRVFLVASIAGGTGSGMVIDAAYAMRQVLAELGFSDDDVCGVLTCSTDIGGGVQGVAPANALACLEELRYFAQPGCDYPGEPQCGLAGFRGDGPTFRNTYLFDIGGEELPSTNGAGVDLLAEYLFLSSLSATSGLYDQARRLAHERPNGESLRLRTAGLCPFAATASEDPAPLAEQLCRYLVRKWKLGLDAAITDERVKLSETGRLYEACERHGEVESPVGNEARAQMERLGIQLESIRGKITDLVAHKLQAEPQSYMRHVIGDTLGAAPLDKTHFASAVETAIRRIHTIVGDDSELGAQRSTAVESLADLVLPEAHALGSRLGEGLSKWILELVDTGSSRVEGARQAVKHISELISSLQQSVTAELETLERELKEAENAVAVLQRQQRLPTKEAITNTLGQFSQKLLNLLIHKGVARAVRALDPLVTAAADQLRELWKDLTQLADSFQRIESVPAAVLGDPMEDEPAGAKSPPEMSVLFQANKKQLIEDLDNILEAQFFQETRSLRQTLLGGGHVRGELATFMRASARKLILKVCHQHVHRYLSQSLGEPCDKHVAGLVQDCLETARPSLLALGGGKRLILSIPSTLDVMRIARSVEQLAGERVSVSIEPEGDLKLCFEVEDLPWEGLQTRFLRQRHDCHILASRLHTRINIDFTVV